MIKECKFDQRFDYTTKYMYVNNEPSVMHCHHYTVLFTDVAIKFKDLNGVENLINAAEDSFFLVLKKYFILNPDIINISDKTIIAQELYASMGMGVMNVIEISELSGKVELLHSHVDEGWLKKFGKSDFPLNFITQGFIKSLFSIVFNKKIRYYKVDEIESIVCGASKSVFKVYVNGGN